MGRDTVQLETAVSTITQEYLLEFTSEYGISGDLHPELPDRGDRIVDFPEGKIGMYTKFFEFANFRIPISQFLFDILGHYQIHLSQLSVIGATKVSHFEIQCCVLRVIPSVNLFRVFYIPSYNSGWMSFSKRPGKNTPQCYTKPLDSLKNWNNRFFWVDERVFPTTVAWRTSAPKDSMPLEGTYSVEDVAVLNARRTPIQKQPETLLCLVGLSRRYFLGDDVYPIFLHDDGREMDLFNLISAPNPTVIKTDTRPRTAYEVPLLTVITSRQIDMEEPTTTSESFGAPSTIERLPLDFSNENPSEQINEVEEEETVTDAPHVSKRRRKRANEESNANAPRKVLRKDFDVSHPTQSTVGGKSLASISLGASSTVSAPASQETPTGTMNPDPISFAEPSSVPEQDIAQSSKGATAAGGPEPDPTSPTMVMSPGSIYEPEWGVTNGYRLDTPSSCQELVDHLAPPVYFSELRHLPNEDFLGQFNMTLAWKVAMGSQLQLRFEQEAKLLRISVAQELRMQKFVKEMESLHSQFTSSKLAATGPILPISTPFAQLDALKHRFDDEECISAYSNGNPLSRVEQGEAKLDLAMVEGYDPEAEGKFIATMQALKDLNRLLPLLPLLAQACDSGHAATVAAAR
ncbi:hypothetical protein Tco_1214440 [Tanacetum coccineum]